MYLICLQMRMSIGFWISRLSKYLSVESTVVRLDTLHILLAIIPEATRFCGLFMEDNVKSKQSLGMSSAPPTIVHHW